MQCSPKSYTHIRGSRQLFARTSFRAVLSLVAVLSVSFGIWSFESQPSASALTTVPTKMNFQGRLTDASGNIKPNGTYNMQFRLYTVASGGSAVWTENRLVSASQGVTVTNGLFSVQLGSVTTLPASLFASGALYLEVQLPTPASATTSSPVWTEPAMTPRNQMATSAYAYNAETLDGLDSASFGQLSATQVWGGTNTFNGDGYFQGAIFEAAVSGYISLYSASSIDTSANTFQVQNTLSTQTFFSVDTVNSKVSVVDVAPTVAATVGSNATSLLPAATYKDTSLGSDGYLRMTYKSTSSSELKYLRCTSADCSTYVDTIVGASTSDGYYLSMALGADGFARIAHYTQAGQDLVYVRCTNIDCSTKVTTTADSTGNIGGDSSIALGADGFARITYSDNANSDLRFLQCTNADCTTSVSTVVDSVGQLAWDFTSVVMAPDGFARILYDDNTNTRTKFVQCTNAACSTNVMTVVDTVDGYDGWLVMGSDGFARLAYDMSTPGFKFTQCTNAACSTRNTTTIDAATQVSKLNIAMGSDGFARISYNDGGNADLKYVRCTNAACSSPVVSVIDSYQSKGMSSYLVLAASDYAYIAYDGTVNGISNTLFTRLTSADGGEVRSGVSLGQSRSSGFANIYTKLLDVQGGITIDSSTHDAYGAALEIRGDGDYIRAYDETGASRLTFSKDEFSFANSAGSISMGAGGGFNMYGGSTTSSAATITQEGAGNGLVIGMLDNTATAFKVVDDNTGNIALTVESDGKTRFTMENTDQEAFGIGDYYGTVFSVDTNGKKVRVGPLAADATGVVFVLDDKNTSGDPTGLNGAMYYNSNLSKFRCYEAGAWKDCITSGFTMISKSTDQTITGTTFAADTELKYSLAANSKYRIKAMLLLTEGPTAPSYYNVTMAGPAGSATSGLYVASTPISGQTYNYCAIGGGSCQFSATQLPASGSASAYPSTLEGYVSTGATAGDVTISFNLGFSGHQLTIKAGSTFEIMKLP